LFTARIDIGVSLYVAVGVESAVDVFFVLDWGRGGMGVY
jgi:hypothetical protein